MRRFLWHPRPLISLFWCFPSKVASPKPSSQMGDGSAVHSGAKLSRRRKMAAGVGGFPEGDSPGRERARAAGRAARGLIVTRFRLCWSLWGQGCRSGKLTLASRAPQAGDSGSGAGCAKHKAQELPLVCSGGHWCPLGEWPRSRRDLAPGP